MTRTAAGSGDRDSSPSRVSSSSGAVVGSARDASAPYDWERLERAVGVLVAAQRELRVELAALRSELGDREHRIRELEAQLLDANQRRQDTGKRIDELISQLDQLDAQLESAEPTG